MDLAIIIYLNDKKFEIDRYNQCHKNVIFKKQESYFV